MARTLLNILGGLVLAAAVTSTQSCSSIHETEKRVSLGELIRIRVAHASMTLPAEKYIVGEITRKYIKENGWKFSNVYEIKFEDSNQENYKSNAEEEAEFEYAWEKADTLHECGAMRFDLSLNLLPPGYMAVWLKEK